MATTIPAAVALAANAAAPPAPAPTGGGTTILGVTPPHVFGQVRPTLPPQLAATLGPAFTTVLNAVLVIGLVMAIFVFIWGVITSRFANRHGGDWSEHRGNQHMLNGAARIALVFIVIDLIVIFGFAG